MKLFTVLFSVLSTFAGAAPADPTAPSMPNTSVLRPNDPISAPVRPDESGRLPTDIYADYSEAKRIWASQNVAKAEVQSFVAQQRQAVAFELKVSEGIINTIGPRVAEDGNVCATYTIDRSNLPIGNISDVSPRMEALARTLSERNDAPITGTNLYATHYRSLAAETNAQIQLLTACIAPDRL